MVDKQTKKERERERERERENEHRRWCDEKRQKW